MASRSVPRPRPRTHLLRMVVVAAVVTALVSALVLRAATPAGAATCKVWAGTGTSASWHDAANWSPAGVPVASDCVLGGSTFTDIVVDADVTIQSWQFSAHIVDITITNGATFRTTSATAESRFHKIVGIDGRLILDASPTAQVGEITVVAGDEFTVAGSSTIKILDGFVDGTLRVGKTAVLPGGARDADVELGLGVALPGTIVVDGPTASELRLTGGTPAGLGNHFGTTGTINNGTKGHTTLADDARVAIRNGQRFTVNGPFTVEHTLNGGLVQVDSGGRLSLDSGFTNYNAVDDALERGRYELAGRIDLPGPLVANRAELTYRGGDFRTGGNVTRPTSTERRLVIEADMTFAALHNQIGPLNQSPDVVVGKVGIGQTLVPVTLTVGGTGFQSDRGSVTLNQGHTLDCTVACATRDTLTQLSGFVIGSISIDDVPPSVADGTVSPGRLNGTVPRGFIDDLEIADDATTVFDVSLFVAGSTPYLDTGTASIAGTLRLENNSADAGIHSYDAGDQFPILRSVEPIVGQFDEVVFSNLNDGLTWNLVVTPTTITAVAQPKPVLGFVAAGSSVVEGTGGNTVQEVDFTLSEPFGYPFQIEYGFSGLTATNNVDFSVPPPTGRLIVPAGVTSFALPATIVGDAVDELDENVGLAVFSNTYIARDPAAFSHALTIVDDDGTAPIISVVGATKTEGAAFASNANITVTRAGSTVAPASVNVATANGSAAAGSDYTAVDTVVSFGVGETSKTFAVPVSGDVVPEPDETVKLVLSSPTGAVLGTAKGTLTILNDDGPPPVLSVADVSVTEGTGGTSSATVTVTRSGTLLGSISAAVAVTAGTASAPADFTASTPVLSFSAGVATRTVTVPIATDAVPEPTELANVTITNAFGATIGQASAVIRIDDDDPRVQVVAAAAATSEGSAGTANLVLSLVRSTTKGPNPVSVKASTANGTAVAPGDYTPVVNQTVTFADGSAVATVAVPIKGDQIAEADETFSLTISNPSAGAVLGAQTSTTVTITNDDGAVPSLTVEDQTIVEPGSAGAARSIRVLRNGADDGAVTFRATSTAGTAASPSDFTAAVVDKTIPVGVAFVDVPVTIGGDLVAEDDEAFSMTLSQVVGATVADGSAAITIVDDDGSGYHPLAPGRLLDSRSGVGTNQSKWQAGQTRSVQVTGKQGVPASGVRAVVLNVTVTGATAGSHLRLFPTGGALPDASSINFDGGQTIANLAMVKLGTGGKVDIFNNSGQVDVIADVVGYYDDGAGGGDRYTGLAPGRLLDSREGVGTAASKWQPGQTRSVQVTGKQGVPANGVGAVVLNVTVTGATAGSHLRLFPTGGALPDASSINFAAGLTIANGAVVKLGSGGSIDIFNNSGQVDVIADVVGYFSAAGDTYRPLAPGRLLDSREGVGTAASKWQPGQTRSVQVTGKQGVPANGVRAVVLNVTVTGPTAGSHLRLFPTGGALPDASSINFDANRTIANLVVVKVGTNGRIDVFNNSGQVHVIADVVGYFA